MPAVRRNPKLTAELQAEWLSLGDPIFYLIDVPITFKGLLVSAGLNPGEVRLLRHMNERGRTPYACWFSDRAAFEQWQDHQSQHHRTGLSRRFWASFVDTPSKETLFVGIYAAELVGPVTKPTPDRLRGGQLNLSVKYDRYRTLLIEPLSDLAGRLWVEWPPSRRWDRRAERWDLPIVELKRIGGDPPYPGHSAFLSSLAEIEALPPSWRNVLEAAKGVYLISCARSREQYVGAAIASGGFIARWHQHAARQGDAVAFRLREPSYYRVSILEVAGSLATEADILAMEQRWKAKLQSREMGLNRN